MTDQELAQLVQDRLLQREAEASAALAAATTERARVLARRRVRDLARGHGWLERAWLALQPAMGLQPLSGGTPKELP